MSESEYDSEANSDVLDCAAEYEELLHKKQQTVTEQALNSSEPAIEAPNQQSSNKSAAVSKTMLLEKAVFGDREGLLKNLKDAVAEEVAEPSGQGKKRKPAWHDADDTEITVGEVKRATRYTGPINHLRKDKSYKEYLTARYVRTVPQPQWASLDHKPQNENAEDEALLQTVGFLAKPNANALQPSYIQIKRLKDLNRATYAEGSISSIQFIPRSTAALVAGEKGIATIYSIDDVKNDKLHSIRFENFPIKCAKLKSCGTKTIFGSTKRHYYIYDLITAQEMRYKLPMDITMLRNFTLSPCGRYMSVAGRFGGVHLFDANSQELIHTFKQEDNVAAMCFTSDSKSLICSSQSSKVHIFSLSKQRLMHAFTDDGCINGNAMDLSKDQRLLATGSMEGVVNVYDFQKVQQMEAPQPEKSILNLRTAIADIKFNHTAELLAMSSADVTSAVKLAHFPSGTVYANFPVAKSDIGKIRVVEFSPNSSYLALGSREKAVNLLRLKHFKYY